MSVDVVTFGCRLNAFESEVIRREAEQAGLEDTIVDIGEADKSGRDATGFKFAPVTAEALAGTLRRPTPPSTTS